MSPESNALVLEISKQDNALKMGLFEQRELISTLRHFNQHPISFAETGRLCQEITSALNKSNKQSCVGEDLIKGLTKAGQLLWNHLLSRPIKEKLRAAKASDLILSLDEELINIPWELLYDGTNFLCLNFNLGRLVRTKKEAEPAVYRSHGPGALRMLILANPTNDLKAAYQEGLNIKNQFDRKRNTVRIDFKSTYIDRLYLKKNMYDYDILHFAGHCEHETGNPKNSGWVLGDGRFTIQDILAMGQGLSLPSLIFCNACHSAASIDNLMDADYQERSYNLASAFLFSGVRHYIGTIRRIEDPVSLTFAKEFYTQLILGKSVGECIRLGRLSLIKEYGIYSIDWANYLLYGDPNFVLFRPSITRPPEAWKIDIARFKKRLRKLSLAVIFAIFCILLARWLPTLNPSAYILFLRTQRLYTQGNNQEVILLSSRITKADPLFLAAYPLLADAYQRLGNKEAALKKYFDYIFYSEKKGDKKNLASSYNAVGWFYHQQGDALKAFDFYQKALALSRNTNDKLNEAVAERRLAVWYIDKKDYTSALELLTKSSEINRQRQHIYEHKYNLACDYFDIGLVFANKNDFGAAKEFYEKSRLLFERLKIKNELSDCYFNLGEIYLFEKQYQKAQENYTAGLEIDQLQDNKMSLAGDYNMLGELYLEMDNPKEAENYFNRAVALSGQINAKQELAAAFYNLGQLYKKASKKAKARQYLRQAQEIYSAVNPSLYQEIKNELTEERPFR